MNGVDTGFTSSGSQSMGGGVSLFAGHTERLPYSANRSRDFYLVRVRMRHDCLMLSIPFLFSCTAYAAQQVCA